MKNTKQFVFEYLLQNGFEHDQAVTVSRGHNIKVGLAFVNKIKKENEKYFRTKAI